MERRTNMNLEEVKQFIKQVGYGMLATTDGRKVGVRPMGGLAPKPGFFGCQNQGTLNYLSSRKNRFNLLLEG